MSSRYGKFSMGAPDYTEDVKALKDLLEKEMITRPEYNKRLAELQRMRNLFIAITNGAFTAKKPKKEGPRMISKLRDTWTAERTKQMAESGGLENNPEQPS